MISRLNKIISQHTVWHKRPVRVLFFIAFIVSVFFIHPAGAQVNAEIDSLQTALETSQADTNRVNILNELVNKYRYIGDLDRATELALQALSLAEDLNYRKGLAKCYRNIGIIYYFQGNLAEAIKNGKIGIDLSIETGDKLNLAKCYNLLGMVYTRQGDYEEALKNHTLALQIRQELGSLEGITDSYGNIGAIYLNMGEYDKALDNFRMCLEIGQAQGAKHIVAQAYHEIGKLYYNQGDYPQALENFLLARQTFEESGINKGMQIGDVYHSIGLIYYVTGSYDEAMRNLKTSLNIQLEADYKYGIYQAHLLIAEIYLFQGNYNEALENYQKSLEISEDMGDKEGIAYSLRGLGVIYQEQSKYTEALEYNLRSLQISEEIGDKRLISLSNINIGYTYYFLAGTANDSLSYYDQACKYLDKALLISKELGEKLLISDCYHVRSEVYYGRGDFQQSLENYKLYIIYKDSILNEENNKELANLKIQFETEQKDKELELLNKDNSIKALQLDQQETSLRASRLETEKKRNEILLLTTSKELQELQLAKTQEDLDHQHLLSEAQAAEMALLSTEKELSEQQLAKQKLQRNVAIIGMAFLVVLGFLIFRSLRLRRKLERQEAIIQERKRISTDLHDDIGTGLSKISLLSEIVRNEAKTPEAKKEAEKIAATSKELLQSIGEIIWALNANNDYMENLVAYVRRYSVEYFENSEVSLKIIAPGNIPQVPVSGECRRNIFYAVKEALHNIIKHARASKAEILFSLDNRHFSVVIRDDGIGVPAGELNRFGNGLRNMKSRMEKINGTFHIENESGTKITLALPI